MMAPRNPADVAEAEAERLLEDRPVEVQDSIVAADRHRFRYEVDMN